MNLNTEYSVEQAFGARTGGEWVVWRTCKVCQDRTVVAWFHTEQDAKMWALMKNEPKAFSEFCSKMGGPYGVDPEAWLKEAMHDRHP